MCSLLSWRKFFVEFAIAESLILIRLQVLGQNLTRYELIYCLFLRRKMAGQAPSVATEAVLKPSCDLPEDLPKIKGYDFNQGVDFQAVLKSYLTTGFQASRLGQAIQEINHMVIIKLNFFFFNEIWHRPSDVI